MADATEFRLQMRSEWSALRMALDDCVERHFRRQEALIAAMNQGQPLPDTFEPPRREIAPIATPPVEEEPVEVWSPRRPLNENAEEVENRSPRAPSKSPSVASKGSETWVYDDENQGLKGMIKRRLPKKVFTCLEWWMSVQEPPRDSELHNFVHGGPFEALCALVIITNGIFAAIAANMEEDSAFKGVPGRTYGIAAGEIIFLSFYCVELSLKLAVHGLFFFINEDMYWNTFDTCLVVFTLYDELSVALFDESVGNVTFMRSLRILKMAKILRVVRVMKYFAELRLILQSLVGSLASLFWSIVMLALIFYIFALCFVQGMTSHLLDAKDTIKPEAKEEIFYYFGTVEDTMLTLYKTSTGGDDWSLYFGIVKHTGTMYSTLFIFFIAFIQIALFNILTAIFVENAMKLAQPDRDAQALEVRKIEASERDELRRICWSLDANGDGLLDVDEFARAIAHGKLKAYLNVLGLDVRDAEVFLKVLSAAAQDEPIEINSFVDGCMRMKGVASSIDMQGLMFETKMIHKENKAFYRDLLENVADLKAGVKAAGGKGGGWEPADVNLNYAAKRESGSAPQKAGFMRKLEEAQARASDLIESSHNALQDRRRRAGGTVRSVVSQQETE